MTYFTGPRINTPAFITKARKIHGRKYSYKNTIFTGCLNTIVVTCRKHGNFPITAGSHIGGGGCPKCWSIKRGMITQEKFIRKAKKLHGNKYDYSLVKYKDLGHLITIICRKHGRFQCLANYHLKYSGCRACTAEKARGCSGLAVKWIEQEARSRRMKNIRHAFKGGEFRIPETGMWVDGYHAPTKTVFEFHGDCFHGNPKVFYRTSKPNPFSDKTASELYRETLGREKVLRDLGYRVVSIWQSEFKQAPTTSS